MARRSLVFLLLLLAPIAQGAITRVQAQSTTSNTGTSENLTVTSTGTGDLGVVEVLNASASTITVTDNKSQTYTCPHNFSFLGSALIQYCYHCNDVGGVTQIQVSGANNNFYTAYQEYSGIATSSCLDQSSAYTDTGFGSPWASPNVTTTQASELLVGHVAYQTATGSITGSGWTTVTSGIGYGSYFMSIGQQIVSSTGTYNMSGTQSGTNAAAAIFTFKAAGAVAAAPTQIGGFLVGP